MVFMDKIGGIFAVAGIFGYLTLTTTYLGTKKIKKNKKKLIIYTKEWVYQ